LAAQVVNAETNAVVLNKTSGVLGADGTGSSNVNIAWTSADLASLTVGVTYLLRVTATSGSDKAVFRVNSRGSLPTIRKIAAPA
jgi:hypothetical protein